LWTEKAKGVAKNRAAGSMIRAVSVGVENPSIARSETFTAIATMFGALRLAAY
jgi:hypothetical protein